MREEHIVRIVSIEKVTHNVKRFRFEKPAGYQFIPGQATEVSINSDQWKEEKRPFTFTCLNDDPYLEFTIKIYKDHDGVTNQLGKLSVGDGLIIRDVWGAIEYKGPGYFIAGGAGITPFIAILRQLHKEKKTGDNRLFFSNKTSADIILKDELTTILGKNAMYVITQEPGSQYYNGIINMEFLRRHVTDINKHFYVCGPLKMVESIANTLEEMGAAIDTVIFEK